MEKSELEVKNYIKKKKFPCGRFITMMLTEFCTLCELLVSFRIQYDFPMMLRIGRVIEIPRASSYYLGLARLCCSLIYSLLIFRSMVLIIKIKLFMYTYLY